MRDMAMDCGSASNVCPNCLIQFMDRQNGISHQPETDSTNTRIYFCYVRIQRPHRHMRPIAHSIGTEAEAGGESWHIFRLLFFRVRAIYHLSENIPKSYHPRES